MMTHPMQKEFGSLSMKLEAVQQFHAAKVMEYHAALKVGSKSGAEKARLDATASFESFLDVLDEHTRMVRRLHGLDDA